jgi:CrcB protein
VNWLFVFLGGGAGSVVRYALARGLSTAASSPFAAAGATLLANALASGLLAWWLWKGGAQQPLHAALAIGFCGGLSTFSTWSAELAHWIKSGNWPLALGYALLSLALGLLPFFVWSAAKGL